MLHIILLILKIIGIILLCILGILLFSILCALFVPLRYRVRVTGEAGGEKPSVVVYVKLTWLLHLVNVLVRYPAEVILRVRIMIFTLFRMPRKEKRSAPKEKQKRKIRKQEEDEAAGGVEQTMSADNEKSAEVKEDAASYYEAFESDFIAMDQESDDAGGDEDGAADGGRTSTGKIAGWFASLIAKIREIIDKIKLIVKKIKDFFTNIQYTIHKFCDKIKTALDNIQYYREVMESEPFRQSLNLCKNELGLALRKLKPDKFEADLTIGMEDPATMGQILAIYGILYPLIGQHVRIAGDFESGRTHIEGQLYIRGKVRAFTFVRVAVKVYFNKNIKRLIRLLKKEAV